MAIPWKLIGTKLLQGIRLFAPLITGKLQAKAEKAHNENKHTQEVMLDAVTYLLERLEHLEKSNLKPEERRARAIGVMQEHPVLSGLSYSESNSLVESGLQAIRSYKSADELASVTAQAFEMVAESCKAASDLIKYG